MEFLFAPFEDWQPFVFLLLAGAVPTQIWRWAGAYLSRTLDESSELLKWVKAVAIALVAGLISKLIVFPSGALADVPLFIRLAAIIIGYCTYFLTRPRIVIGIVVAEAILILATLLAP